MSELATTKKKSVLNAMAERFEMEPAAFEATVKRTVMPADITNEQFAAFLLVAKEYNLNPITKEVYAFPTKGGGIQPIVSIDGWLNIINSHPQFDGMKFIDNTENGKLVSVTCIVHRKDRNNPTEVTEYMSECNRGSDPWKKYPARMLRHKAVIQAARYAFGFSGIIEPDEAERFEEAGVIDATTAGKKADFYAQDDFDTNFPKWEKAIETGKKTADEIVAMVSTKAKLTDEQVNMIKAVAAPIDAEVAQ